MRKVYDREEMETAPPAFMFSWSELQEITTAMKADREIKKTTLAKMQSFAAYARTKYAYQVADVMISAK